jgi:hypothetical protein
MHIPHSIASSLASRSLVLSFSRSLVLSLPFHFGPHRLPHLFPFSLHGLAFPLQDELLAPHVLAPHRLLELL